MHAACGLALSCCILISCSRSSPQRRSCRGEDSVAAGVVWAGVIDKVEPNDDSHRWEVRIKVQELAKSQTSDLRSTLQLVPLAAEFGDYDLAVKFARARLAQERDRPEVRSLAAATLLARFLHSGANNDLLDAGELLADEGAGSAARCNRLLALHRLGLSYRLNARKNDCPCLDSFGLPGKTRFPLDGHRHSADQLAPSELAQVETLLAGGNQAQAREMIRRNGQAWRVWFELGALELWRTAGTEADRRAVETRIRPLTEVYAEADENPAPMQLWAELGAIPPHTRATVKESLTHWEEGISALSRYEPDRVESELRLARQGLAARLPALLPSIDLALAAARFHMGDDRGMLERSLAVRRSVSRDANPWAHARALWLEALALQARADWSQSLRRAEEAGHLFARLGEPANSGYQDVIRGVAFESQDAEESASSAYLAGVTRIREAGDTRLLAGALALLARQQSRAGRPHLAVELQRESTVLDIADATPQLVAEAKAILAEQLFRSGASTEGNQVLQQARDAARRIESAQPRRRAEAIMAQVEASGARDTNPVAAEKALGRFLSEFDTFGERFFRAEALVERAEARLRLGKQSGAEEDLALALSEIANQSERLEDRVQSVVLLDRARDALERLVDVFLRMPDGPPQALDWIERLRAEQIGLGFGHAKTPGRRGLINAPRGTCITEYWAAPAELLAWTSCDGQAAHLDRIKVSRDELLRELTELKRTSQQGNLAGIRQHSVKASTWLIAPIEKSLARSLSWVVIPDALFPSLPLAWLTLNGRFVFEDRVVKTAPSWSQLSGKAPRAADPWKGLGIGDPDPDPKAPADRLPFARAEAKRLPALFPGSSAKVGGEATFTAMLQQRNSFNLLHLATHLSSGSRVPLSARLMLAPEPNRPDGRVSADEVSRVRFTNLRLAVVASCSSAAGAPAKIAGGLDFVNAFLHAGTEQALGTLWDVPDREVSPALAEFYGFLKAGVPSDQALQRVWLTALRKNASDADRSVRAALQLSTTTF